MTSGIDRASRVAISPLNRSSFHFANCKSHLDLALHELCLATNELVGNAIYSNDLIEVSCDLLRIIKGSSDIADDLSHVTGDAFRSVEAPTLPDMRCRMGGGDG